MKANELTDIKERQILRPPMIHPTLRGQKNGICVRIRPTIKDGTTYFVLDYRAQGKRKLVWRSTMADARESR